MQLRLCVDPGFRVVQAFDIISHLERNGYIKRPTDILGESEGRCGKCLIERQTSCISGETRWG